MPLAVWLFYRSIDADEVSPWGMAVVTVAALVAWTLTEYALGAISGRRHMHDGGAGTSTETAHGGGLMRGHARMTWATCAVAFVLIGLLLYSVVHASEWEKV